MRTVLLKVCVVAVLSLAMTAAAEMPEVGTAISSENAERYAEVLNPTQRYMIAHGVVMPVTAARKYEWQPAYRRATEKFSNLVTLSADGRDIVNYVAGAPFPVIDENDPQAGAKWMWNHEQGPKYTDNAGVGWSVELVDSKGEREKVVASNYLRRMMWRGRLSIDPKPLLPHDPAIAYAEQWGPLYTPADLRGSALLSIRYVSPDVPDDSYIYLPTLRRVHRLSMAQRSESLWGMDLDIDSIWSWNSKLSIWTFKYLGTRRQLSAFHSGGYGQREAWCAEPDGQSGVKSFFACVNHEIRDTVVVEATPSGIDHYAYGKRIVYIDKESLMAQFNEGYDGRGELWRASYLYSDAGTTPHEIERKADGSIELVPTRTTNPPRYDAERLFPTHGGVVDVRLDHASKWDAPNASFYPNLGITHWYHDVEREWNTPEAFTVAYLIKTGGF